MRLRKSHPQQQRGLGSAFFDTLYFNFHVSDAFTGLSATDAWHRAEPVMQHIQHLSFESLVKMDHFQKELNSTSQKRSAEPVKAHSEEALVQMRAGDTARLLYVLNGYRRGLRNVPGVVSALLQEIWIAASELDRQLERCRLE